MVPILGRLTEQGNSFAIVVPKPALAELGWMKREPVALSVEQGYLVVSSIRAAIGQHQRGAADALVARVKAL